MSESCAVFVSFVCRLWLCVVRRVLQKYVGVNKNMIVVSYTDGYLNRLSVRELITYYYR